MVSFSFGDLVRPVFDNETVYLFARDPEETIIIGDSISVGPAWKKNCLGVIVNTRGPWVQILIDGGKLGWIGDWNVEKVK